MGDEEVHEYAAQKTLLIVENNELNLKLYKDLLQAEGYRVLHTKDGGEAFEIALSIRPDLILIGIQLPEISGLEVTQWLKQQESAKEIPVIAVTSSAMKGDEERIAKAVATATWRFLFLSRSSLKPSPAFLEAIRRRRPAMQRCAWQDFGPKLDLIVKKQAWSLDFIDIMHGKRPVLISPAA